MRDIVYRPKRSSAPSQQEAQPTAPSTDHVLTRVIEGGINVGGAALDWVSTRFDTPTTPAVVQEQQLTIGKFSPTKETAKRRRSAEASKAGERARSAARATKEAAKRGASHLKTPLGKMAAAHTLAILALFGYVAQTNPGQGLFEPRDAAEAVQGAALRMYLPNPSSVPSPQAFDEHLASVPRQRLPLNTWATPWNLSDIAQHTGEYATISAFWLTVNEDGTTFTPKADWSLWEEFRRQNYREGQRYYLTVTGNPNFVVKALENPSLADAHIANLLALVQQYNFDGIDLDYEALGGENRDAYTAFVRRLAQSFHARNKSLSLTLEARLANRVPMDWQNLGEIADQVRIMAYDYHSKTTAFPGPIAPLGWVQEILQYASANIEARKLSVALPNYGYAWKQVDDGSWEGQGISFDYAKTLSEKYKAPIIRATGIDDRGYDIGSIPMLVYKDENNVQYSVWFEDNASIQEKINLVNQYNVSGGIFFWSVGLGDAEFWQQQSASNN